MGFSQRPHETINVRCNVRPTNHPHLERWAFLIPITEFFTKLLNGNRFKATTAANVAALFNVREVFRDILLVVPQTTLATERNHIEEIGHVRPAEAVLSFGQELFASDFHE